MQKLTKWKMVLVLAVFGSGHSAFADIGYRYFYDDLDRVTKAADSTGVAIEYVYDEVGNHLSVTRSVLAPFAILDVAPAAGAVGARVVIEGRGFSAVAGNNQVAFNGTAATVVSATTTRLEVDVPAGAATGPLTVSVGGDTVTAGSDFQVQVVPVITGLSTQFVLAGTPIPVLTITGENLAGASFDFTPAFLPPALTIDSAVIATDGASADLAVSIRADAAGSFVLQATNAAGQSGAVSEAQNTLTVLGSADDDLDGDGLTNGEELALGTDPTTGDSDGDGLPDQFEVVTGFDPNDPADAFVDTDRDGISNLDEFAQGTDPLNPDTTPPAVAQIDPVNDFTDFPTNGRMVVRFNEPLQVASVFVGSMRVFQGALAVAGEIQLSDDLLSITFKPSESLSAFTTYTLQVQGVRDEAGNPMSGVFESRFTTGEFIDDVSPTVSSTSIGNGQTAVPVNAPYTVRFDEPMDPATLDDTSFSVRDNTTFQNLPGMIQIDADGMTVSFVPDQPLPIGRNFSVSLDASRIADTSGNLLTGRRFFSFTTGFETDTAPPVMLGVSPVDGAANVPLNTSIQVLFSEPLNLVDIQNAVRLQAAGSNVPGSIALSDGNRRMTFTPAAALAPALLHTLDVSAQITDLAGNAFAGPVSTSFTTGTNTDTTRPTLVSTSIPNNALDVPVDVSVQVSFSEPMNVLTLTPATVYIDNATTGVAVAGTVTVAADGMSATFTPSAPLAALTRYRVRTFSMQDLVGNVFSGTSVPVRFTTGTGTDSTPPAVAQTSLSGALQAPVNAQLVVQLSEPVDIFSVVPGSVRVSAGGVPVAGRVTLSADRRSLTFIADGLLAANTTYDISVTGLLDLGGNVLTPFTDSFTTGLLSVADTARPSVAGMNPASGSTGVAVDTPLVVVFSEAVDPTSVSIGSLPVTVDGFSGSLAADYVVVANQISITPLNPLPGAARIRVTANGLVRDLAGNTNSFFQGFFDTAATPDTVAPTVLSVTPGDGSTGVGRNTAVILTFSESLNASTINGSNFTLFADGVRISTSVSRSSDNRTVTLSATLPADSLIQVAVTSAVQDLSGNALADFISQFSTGPAIDNGQPTVTTQRPGNGANNVPLNSTVVLFASESLDSASVAGALHLSQDGAEVSGSVRVTADGRAVEFIPDVPWSPGALVQVFLDGTAQDTSGNALRSYQGSFRTLPDPALQRPSVVRDTLASISSGALLNPVLELEFSEALDATTVDGSTVQLRENTTGNPLVAATVSLRGDRTIRVVADAALTANTRYFLDVLNGVQDLQGQTPNASTNPATVIFRRFFTTGDQSDSVAPTVAAVSPPDGVADVPLNTQVRVRFDEPINVLTVDESSVLLSDGASQTVACSIAFRDGDREVLLVPHELLAENQLYSLTIAGVEDRAGNAVTTQVTSFTSAAALDTVRPQVVSRTPFSGATDVPVNSAVILRVSERVDPLTVTAATLIVRDNTTFQSLPGSYSVSADGREISFAPDAPFAVGRSHTVFVSGSSVQDLTGNTVTGANFSFTTAFTEDTTAPRVVGTSPTDGAGAVPLNAQVQVRFDEPVQGTQLGGVSLSANGTAVPVAVSLSDANRLLTLTPRVLLDAATLHTLTVNGVRDLAGNALPDTTGSFTTGTSFDLTRPTLVSTSIPNNALDVPVDVSVQVSFSEPMNVLTLTPATVYIDNATTGVAVAGTVTVAADGMSATFTPSAPLAALTRYRVRTFSMQDLVGNVFSGTSVPVRFTTAP